MSKFVKFFNDESGASAAEYALILAVVGLGILAASKVLSNSISGAMNAASTVLVTAAS
jgi:pilus assembly protein Flp/PilA